jgi:hypothetical protein
MNDLRIVDVSDIIAQAASALSGASGCTVKIDEMHRRSGAIRSDSLTPKAGIGHRGHGNYSARANRKPRLDCQL